jgi:hypothetical protein
MMHRPALFSVVATVLLATPALAKDDTTMTVSIPIPGADQQPLVASVVTVNEQTTSFTVRCPSGESSNKCGMGPGLAAAFISGATWTAVLSEPGEFTESYEYRLDSSQASATYMMSMGGHGANFPGVTTHTMALDKMPYMPVTVTAGADKLQAPPVPATPTPPNPSSPPSPSTPSAPSAPSTPSSPSTPTGAGGEGAGVRVSPEHAGFALGTMVLMWLNWIF